MMSQAYMNELHNELKELREAKAQLTSKCDKLLAAMKTVEREAEAIRELLKPDTSLVAGEIRGHLASIVIESGLALEATANAGGA